MEVRANQTPQAHEKMIGHFEMQNWTIRICHSTFFPQIGRIHYQLPADKSLDILSLSLGSLFHTLNSHQAG